MPVSGVGFIQCGDGLRLLCRKHLHHKSRKFSLQEGARGALERRVSIEPAEEPLPEADADELHSHRSDDPRALRRHKIQPRVTHTYLMPQHPPAS